MSRFVKGCHFSIKKLITTLEKEQTFVSVSGDNKFLCCDEKFFFHFRKIYKGSKLFSILLISYHWYDQ